MVSIGPPDHDDPDDGVRWLAGVIAEMLRVGLALLAKRYPEMRGKTVCPNCGFRHPERSDRLT